MANAFNLTAQINLQGPSNIKSVVSNIKKQLGNISADVNLKIDANSNKNIGALNKNLVLLKKNALGAKAVLDQLGSAAGRTASSYKDLSSSAAKISAATQKNSKNFKDTGAAVARAGTAIEDFGKQSALAVKRFAAFTVVTSIVNQFTGAISDAIGEFVAFDRQLVRIAQVTGGTKKQLKDLSGEITRLASSFGVSSSSLAEVSVTLSQAGLTATETRIALQALAKADLAPTFDNLKNTTEGAIAAMRQFSLSANELEGALGSINAVAGRFAVEASDIITAISRVGGVFAASSRGISEGQDALNEFIALFTSVRATTRESAETIATGLRTIFTRIQRGSTINFLREFGVELQDLEGNFVGPYEAIRRLSEGLAGIDPRSATFNKIIEELGGFRQVGKVIPLLQEFSTAQEALNVAQRGSGSLTDAAAKAQQSLAIQLLRVREEFLGLVRDIGESKTFQFLTNTALGFASALIKVVGAFKPILPLLTALTAVKGVDFLTQFGSGFAGALKGAGGAKGVGQNVGDILGGGSKEEKTQALNANTTALNTLTQAVNNLVSKMGTGGSTLAFARGGSVPGTGNRDTVPAMLQPGEFVIRKSAVQAFGAGNLSKINKYKAGGGVHKAELLNAIDGDSLSVNFTPTESPYKTSSRLVGGDAYETNSPRGTKAKFLADAATKITQDWASNRDLTENFAAANKYDSFGRPMFEAPDLLQKLREGVSYRGKQTSLLTGRFEKKAKGGGISGSDTVPALLTPGEFVVNKRSAQSFGYGNLKKINGYNKGGVVGVQRFADGGNVRTVDLSTGDTLDASKAVSALNYLASASKNTGDEVKKSGLTFDKAKRRTLAFIERTDDRFAKFGGVMQVAGAGVTVFAGKLGELGSTFEQLTGSAAETSIAFQSAVQGLKGVGSGIQSGAVLGGQLGGARGAKIGAAAGGALLGLQGAIQGFADATKAAAEKKVIAAEKDLQIAKENLEVAVGIEDRLQTFRDYKTALVAVDTAQQQAAASADSFASRASNALGVFAQIVSTLASIAVLFGGRRGRARGKATGGIIYASDGQLVDFQPKGTDTVPAMLTPGEFVVNARSTKKHRGILEAINKSKGGIISPQYLRVGGEGVAGDIVDIVQNESESMAGFGAEIAVDFATGVVPFAGAVKDFASASANLAEGKYLDAGIDAMFGLYDAFTDTIQTAGYATGAGAGVAAAAGGAEQVAQDQLQKGLKKNLKELGPWISKNFQAGSEWISKKFKSGSEWIGKNLDKGKKWLSGTSIGKAVSGVFGRFFGGKAAKTGSQEAFEKFTKTGADSAASKGAKGLFGGVTKYLNKFTGGIATAIGGITAFGSSLFQSKASVLAQAEAARASAQRTIEFSKVLGERLPDILSRGTPEDRAGLGGIDLKEIQDSLSLSVEEQNRQFSDLQSASSLLRASAIQLAREKGDTRSEAEIAKENEQQLRQAYLIDKGLTPAEAAKQSQGEFENADQEKAFDAWVTSQERAARQATVTAVAVDSLTKATEGLAYVAMKTAAVTQKLSNDMNQIVSVSDGVTSAIEGQATAMAGMRDLDTEILINPQAFSAEEVAGATSRVAAAGGGGRELQTAGALVELDRAMKDTMGKFTENASAQFRQDELEMAFEGIGEGLGEDFEKFKDSLISTAVTSGGDPKAQEEFNKKLADAQKLLTSVSKLRFEGLQKLNRQADKLTAAMGKLMQLQLQGAQNFVNDSNRLKEALGQEVTQADRERGANAQLDVFRENAGMAPGTEMSPAALLSRFENLQTERENQQAYQERAATMPTGTTAEIEAKSTTEADAAEGLAELNHQSNATVEALRFLANDTTKLDAALNALTSRTKQLEAQQRSFVDILIDPEQMGEQLANLQAVQAGQGDTQQVGEALKFLESQRDMMDPEDYRRERERILRGGVESGAISEQQAERLSQQYIDEDKRVQEAKKDAEEAIRVRREANAALQELQEQGIQNTRDSMLELADVINKELIVAIRRASESAGFTREKEEISREEQRNPPRPYNKEDEKLYETTAPQPTAPQAGPTTTPSRQQLFSARQQGGEDLTAAPAQPTPLRPSAPTQAPAAAGAGGVAGSIPLDVTNLPSALTVAGEQTVNVVVDGTQFMSQIDGLAASVQAATFESVSQAINQATNGQIQLQMPASNPGQPARLPTLG